MNFDISSLTCSSIPFAYFAAKSAKSEVSSNLPPDDSPPLSVSSTSFLRSGFCWTDFSKKSVMKSLRESLLNLGGISVRFSRRQCRIVAKRFGRSKPELFYNEFDIAKLLFDCFLKRLKVY